jgi:hypothetical protein
MDETSKLQQENELLKKKLSLFENDAVFRGYYALNRIINAQVDYINSFDITHHIGTNAKDGDKVYERASKMWEGLEGLITSLNKLKTELSVSGDEEKDKKKIIPRTSPESVANALGNTAGQQS